MDEPKKLKSPILEIWRRLKEQHEKRKQERKNEKSKEEHTSS